MATQNLPSFPSFSVHTDTGSTGPRWEKYVKRLEIMFDAFTVTEDKQKRALLLHYAGEEVMDVFDTLPDTGADYKTAHDKLQAYFSPKRNIEYERFMFRETTQEKGETVDMFQTRLQKLAEHCEFHDKNQEIKSQIIRGCLSARLRRRALREEQTLQQLLDLARSLEVSESQALGMEKPVSESATVNAVKFRKPRSHKRQPQRQRDKKACFCCGGEYPHESECPAKGKTCNFCKKKNHFAKYCKSKTGNRTAKEVKVKAVQQEVDSSEEEYVFTVNSKHRDKTPSITARVNNIPLPMLIDTGATSNIMSFATYNSLPEKPELDSNQTIRLYAYGTKEPLPVAGTISAELSHGSQSCPVTFVVTKPDGDTLISYNTASKLNMVMIPDKVNAVAPVDADYWHNKYSDLFHGIGKLKGEQCRLHEDKSVKPIVQPHRRIPFHVRKKTEKELQKLLDLDIIERVGDEPTPWVSPIQVVQKPKKPDDVRICVDMRAANKAIQRERHITPTLDDIITDLNGATVFSKLDLNAGYHQIELDPESRHLTVFSTHDGLFRYKRLNFGVCSAAELFQNYIQSALQGLDGVLNISDDILTFGRNEQEHNERLDACLQRLREKNLTLNKDKCRFKKSQVEFYGCVFSRDGVSPDPKKVAAIRDAPPPKNAAEVKSFLGMVNYCGRFISDLATMSEPLRELTKESTKWKWSETEQNALDRIKEKLVADCTLAYFDPKKRTEVLVDASPVGLGAILTQRGDNNQVSVVTLASRSLTPVEQRYSQTEREALAVTWGILHFHLYLYGSQFQVTTDHKPLVPLFNTPTSKAPTRIHVERWILKLQEYNYKVVYQPGKLNPADYMSRHPLPTTRQSSREEKIAEEHINFITQHTIPKTVRIQDIQQATLKDDALQLCIEAMQHGKWRENLKRTKGTVIGATLRSLHATRDKLTVTASKDLVLHGNRIVIPQTLRQKIIDIAHEGHQGIVKTKQLIREKVWFPRIDAMVEQTINSCIACQATTVDKSREPLKMSKLPDGPWLEVSVDFADLATGEYLLVITDDYSRFPEVEVISSTSARTVIPRLDRIFSLLGTPLIVRTDNGPPFNGV